MAAFLTALFKAVESSPQAVVVYTLAIGKEGKAIDAYAEENQAIANMMAELSSISARKATLLDPTGEDETVKVLRRRLFEHIDDEQVQIILQAYQQVWQPINKPASRIRKTKGDRTPSLLYSRPIVISFIHRAFA